MDSVLNFGLVFVRPSILMKQQALDFLNEFKQNNSDMNGFNGLNKCESYNESYEEWLEFLDLSEKGEIPGRIASTTLFAVRCSDGIIAGISDIRHNIDPGREHMPSYINGNMGGSVRPSLRGMGYGTVMLMMSILRSAEFGNKSVYVNCDKGNTASERSIIKCGGVFENEVTEEDGNIVRRYCITVINDKVNPKNE